MAVMKNKNNTELYVDCNCKCGDGIHIRIDKEDPEYYCILAYTNSSWYRTQDERVLRVIHKKLKKIWAIIKNKDYCYSDIIMTKDEFKELKDYINSL